MGCHWGRIAGARRRVALPLLVAFISVTGGVRAASAEVLPSDPTIPPEAPEVITVPDLPVVTVPELPSVPSDLPVVPPLPSTLPSTGQDAPDPRAGVPVSPPSSPRSPVPGPQGQPPLGLPTAGGDVGQLVPASVAPSAFPSQPPASRSVVDAAREFAFPFALAGFVLLFLAFESRLGLRDPKLSEGPVLADDEQLGFA